MKNVHFEGKHADITDKLIKSFYEVYKQLGYGFSEKVYENATALVAASYGLQIEQQVAIPVYFLNAVVGEYRADMLVNRLVIVEFKATNALISEHEAQLLNYLKATPIEVGLLVNFGPKLEYKRKVYDNVRKGTLSWTNWKFDVTS